MPDYKAAIKAGIEASQNRSRAISDVIMLIDQAGADCLELTGCVTVDARYAGFNGDIHISNGSERKQIARIDVSDIGYPMTCRIEGKAPCHVENFDGLVRCICDMLSDGWVGMSILDMKTNKEREDRIARNSSMQAKTEA